MGRPLSKKYMGNRNIGSTSTSADNGIGGEGLATVSTATVGSININNSFPHFPTLTVAAPTIPGGVTAITAITWEIDTVTFDGGGTTYTTGLTTAITGLTAQASVAPVINITAAPGGAPSTYNFTGGSRGEFTSIDATGITTWAVVQGAHTGAQATITFRVKSIAVSEKGSGYVTVPSLSWTTLSGTTPSGQTPALTVDTGAVGSATNQENAIIAYAYIGGALRLVDLVKQISTKRYKVRYNGTNYTARIRYDAVADGSAGYTAAEGVELNIVALDSAGGSYLVRKLYNRTCTLNPVSISRLSATAGTAITAGKQTKWSFSSATTGVVQIENA
jgi:hypothetical protein